jgi:hypothetical protein
MSRRVFKVVEPVGDAVYRSALAGLLPSGAEVEYRVDVPTCPRVPGSGLLAFETIEAAKVFAYSHPDCRRRDRLQVWQADASGLLIMPMGLPGDAISGQMGLEELVRFWRDPEAYLAQAAPGVIVRPACDSVLCADLTLVWRVRWAGE